MAPDIWRNYHECHTGPDLSTLFPSIFKDIYPKPDMTSLKELPSSPVNPYPSTGDKRPAPLPKVEKL